MIRTSSSRSNSSELIVPSIFCLVISLRCFFSFFRRSLSRSVFSRSRSPTPTPFFMKLNILFDVRVFVDDWPCVCLCLLQFECIDLGDACTNFLQLLPTQRWHNIRLLKCLIQHKFNSQGVFFGHNGSNSIDGISSLIYAILFHFFRLCNCSLCCVVIYLYFYHYYHYYFDYYYGSLNWKPCSHPFT